MAHLGHARFRIPGKIPLPFRRARLARLLLVARRGFEERVTMTMAWSRGLQLFGVTLVLAAGAAAGCGSSNKNNTFTGPGDDSGTVTDGGGGDDSGDGSSLIGN